MNTRTLVDALKDEQAVIVATDTVYGLMATSGSSGHRQIFELKLRPEEQTLPCFVNGAHALDAYAQNIPDYARRLADMFWPGPLTIVLYASEKSCSLGAAASDKTIALRCPQSDDLLSVINDVEGLLVCTSANEHGKHTTSYASELPQCMLKLVGAVDLPEACICNMPSTIVDCTGEYPVILREGPIDEQVILDVAIFGARLDVCK